MDCRPRSRADHVLQSALLLHLTMLHPAELTEAALVRDLGDAPDAVAEAIETLVEVDLLLRDGELVRPTPPALAACELLEMG